MRGPRETGAFFFWKLVCAITMGSMHLGYACPAGTPTCNDVIAINGLLLLFPFAVVLAFLVAWPLSRVLPLRPRLGWSLAIVGAVIYVYLASRPDWSPLSGFFVSAIGIALVRGKRVTDPRAGVSAG
jgi:hypothetical protein